MNLDWNERATTPMAHMFAHFERMYTNHCAGYIEDFHPFALATKANQEDYPTYREIMKMNDKDRDKWIESMAKEMEGLHGKGMYELIDCEEAQKSGCHIVPTIWAF
jgi:hypothetical protein